MSSKDCRFSEMMDIVFWAYESLKSMIYTPVSGDFRAYIKLNTSMCNFNDILSYDTIPYLMAPASVFIIALTFFTRWNLKKIIFPYDILNYYGRNQLLCVIFVAYANMLLSSWVESDFERSLSILEDQPNLRRALFKILLMLVYGTAAYPLLAALTHPFILLRFCTTLYSGLFFGLHVYQYYRVVDCKRQCPDCGYNIRDYFAPLPSIISFGILSIAYLLLFIETVNPGLACPTRSVEISPEDYVRLLFRDKKMKYGSYYYLLELSSSV